ncbi:hypothetical protein BU15DRAFT_81347 [Melanogaster broomeanus]|nr:hypothetical protein BU15DRAFT_81347 [Melanogaster broomeanus]
MPRTQEDDRSGDRDVHHTHVVPRNLQMASNEAADATNPDATGAGSIEELLSSGIIPLPISFVSVLQRRSATTNNTHIEMETSAGSRKRKNFGSSNEQPFLRFTSSDFGLSALLYAQPSLSTTMNYAKVVTNTSSHGFITIRPTIEPSGQAAQ